MNGLHNRITSLMNMLHLDVEYFGDIFNTYRIYPYRKT